MNIALTVVVAAIVILITALVVITIFGSGVTQVSGIAEARSLCQTQCQTSCQATGSKPITWGVPTVRDSGGDLKSCEGLGLSCPCSGTTPSGGGTTGNCIGRGRCSSSGCASNENSLGELDCGAGNVCCASNN